MQHGNKPKSLAVQCSLPQGFDEHKYKLLCIPRNVHCTSAPLLDFTLLNMLVVNKESSCCDICLDPYEWDDALRTPHIIDCGHVFCAQCLRQVYPTKCPLCRKIFIPSEVQKLHIECSSSDAQMLHIEGTSDARKEEDSEMDLLRQLVLVYGSTGEEVSSLRTRVDAWLETRGSDESPLRKARDVLDNYHQLKQKRKEDRRKIKILERTAYEWEKTFQDSSTRKQAEAAIMEQALRSQVAEHQAQIAQLRAEIDKRQLQLDRKVKKKPLPIPKPLSISNPLPSPPRLVPVPNKKPAYFSTWNETGRAYPQPASRFPIHERDNGVDSEDNAAYFTCRSTPYWLDEEIIADEPLLQRPLRNIFN